MKILLCDGDSDDNDIRVLVVGLLVVAVVVFSGSYCCSS